MEGEGKQERESVCVEREGGVGKDGGKRKEGECVCVCVCVCVESA